MRVEKSKMESARANLNHIELVYTRHLKLTFRLRLHSRATIYIHCFPSKHAAAETAGMCNKQAAMFTM